MAGRYRPYETYQKSFAAWSGDVPHHWQPIRLKHVFQDKKKNQNASLPAGSISFGNVIFKNEDTLAPETKAAYQEVLSGEFLVNPLNMNFDLISLRTALSSIDVVVSTGYLVLQSGEGYDKNFLRWLLQQFDVAHMKTLGAGVRQTISFTDIGNSFVFEPPLAEQNQIAAFLDHETAKIDTLIDKQQRLIALLEEKRQAVISHAVTKGLHPDAPLRPSGIDWLGDVPAHWEVKRLKFLASPIGTGGTPKNANSFSDAGEIPWFTPGDFVEGFPLSVAQKQLSKSAIFRGDAKPFSPRSILVVGIGATLGKIAICNNVFSCNQQVNVVTPIAETNIEYLAAALASQLAQMKAISNSSTIGIMNQERTGMILLAIAPKLEQDAIAAFLDEKSISFRTLIEKAQSAITLLKERRTALISAAVTGKIDVRDWSPPDAKDQAA